MGSQRVMALLKGSWKTLYVLGLRACGAMGMASSTWKTCTHCDSGAWMCLLSLLSTSGTLCDLHSLSFLTLHCYTHPLFHVLCKPLCTAGMLTVQHSMRARCCAFTLAQLGVTTAKSPHACAPPAQPCPTTGYLSPLLSNSPFGNQSQVLPIFPHQT